ncbi:MAG TPA: hypothetical protein PKG77_01125 [Phycisphaerae bacterium]|nr:hypothetical protein [Phycisphaerae bacterium]HQL74044.1 hypothetical protein [Phycisphaerae bacterium]
MRPDWLVDTREGKQGKVSVAERVGTAYSPFIGHVEECGVYGSIIYGKAADGFFFFDTRTSEPHKRNERTGLSREQWLDMLRTAGVPEPPDVADPERIAATRPHQELCPHEYRYGAWLGLRDDVLAPAGVLISWAGAFAAGAACRNLKTSGRIAWVLTLLVLFLLFEVFRWDGILPLIFGGFLEIAISIALVWLALWLGRKVAGRLPKAASAPANN